jgi:hypothetical protein
LNGQVAHTIEEKFPALKESHPEVLARHWSEAGETGLAIGEWSRAGTPAEARNAFKEAERSYQQALAQLSQIPESPERDRQELELRQHVVVMCYITRGYAAPETVSATERFVALASKSGDMTQFVNASYRTAFIAFVSGDLPAAYELADRALGLAVREGTRSLLATLHRLQIFICYWRGDPAGVENHYAKGVEFFDDRHFEVHATIGPWQPLRMRAGTLGR